MKVIITIPAYNEEETIAAVIKEIPRSIPGGIVKSVMVVVIDDASTDNTIKEAKNAGADNIVGFKQNKGLASAFREGIDTALSMGADIVVNIDADGQYDGGEIPGLIEPIIKNEADMVLGSRFKGSIEEMPRKKRIGNIIATKVTSFVSGVRISDAQTGFRAFSREAALRLSVLSYYTYVQETIIQAADLGLKIVEVPCHFRKRKSGDSRLISTVSTYAKNAVSTIVRTYLRYRPLKVFLYLGGSIFSFGILAGLRVVINFLQYGSISYYPTMILATILILIGFQIIILGLLADLVDNNRRFAEEILYRMKK